MKKLLLILLMGLLIMLFLSGCGKKEEPKVEPAVEEPVETVTEDTTAILDTTAVEEDTTGEAIGQ